ncbi:hypothetical protein A3H75_03485 [Candidatus Uhrbacteria bacterium RIFCSPLOWO2_02_FULL_51_9]|uniref:Transcription regulator TrmB N-terminal domain-containing protein n=1 Tax=Candidatus Uhrbacteria bacterium RIFCSPLOWO2_02_FULL_51_9 TaxID=1802410 RepID=A0A1F7VDJ9_9BACT|nr:MAG: hypothetical protein A3H75_03485 [Candidatus Uhrbacteria bacterium RIFCSPLOWO2_02_FULL_51_9]
MESQQLIKDLRKVGLTDKAAAIYAAVLELGVAFPSKVAEITKLNRTTVYHVLTDLAVKGLVTELERKKKLCYQIERPGRLVAFTKSQIRLAEERAVRAKKLVPELEGLFNLIPNKPRVRFFEGIEGVLAVYEDHISERKPYEMVSYSNVEKLMKFLPERFVQEYIEKKERIGITTRAVLPDTQFSAAYNTEIYRGAPKKTLVDSRLIPADTFPYEAEITMYGENKVSIINFQKDALVGVIIEDETVAGMMRMIFELAWKGAA